MPKTNVWINSRNQSKNMLKYFQSFYFTKSELRISLKLWVFNDFDKMMSTNYKLLNYLSPKNWAEKIKSKVFIIHGANDSMVPFTESTRLSQTIPNNKILISFLYEHREISTDSGIFFKIKELIKMIFFFANYFRYSK